MFKGSGWTMMPLVLAALLLGCSGSSSAPTPAPAPSFTLGLNPTAGSVQPGGDSIRTTLAMVRNPGYTKEIGMALTVSPAGPSVVFAASSGTTWLTQDNRADVIFQAAQDVKPGEYVVTLRAGEVLKAEDQSTTFRLTVGPSTLTPCYRLQFQDSPTVAAGQSLQVPVQVLADGGFNGTVTLSLGDLPAGLTASLAPATLTGSGTATLTLQASATLAKNAYYLLLKGDGGGVDPVRSYLLVWVQ